LVHGWLLFPFLHNSIEPIMKTNHLKLIRIIAISLGILSSSAGLWFLMRHAALQPNQGAEFITIKYLGFFLFFGFVLALFRPKEGGIVQSFGSLIMFMYLMYMPEIDQPEVIFAFTGFLATGILFILFSHIKSREERKQA